MKVPLIKALVCALAGAAVAWFAGSDAVANNTKAIYPDNALWYQPNQNVALIAKSERMMSENPNKQPTEQLRAMATASLKAQALYAPALRMLGLTTGEPRATALIDLAQRASRRDLLTQIWLIEKAAEADQLEKALSHFDIGLSISSGSEQGGNALLLPVLSNAMEDPQIRTSFAKLVRQKPVWLGTALGYIISGNKQPEFVADMLIQAGPLPKEAEYRTFETLMLSQLRAANKTQEALRYYLSLPGVNKAVSNDPRFLKTNINQGYAPIHWTVLAANANEGRFVELDDSDLLALEGDSGSGARGQIAEKNIYFPPGLYRVREGKRPQSEVRGSIYPMLYLTCVTSNGPGFTWKSRFSEFDTAPPISIGPDCTSQVLQIFIQSEDGKPGSVFVGSPLIEKIGG